MKILIYLFAICTVHAIAADGDDRESRRSLLNSELRTAVQENRTVAALRLIRQGANVDCMDDWGLTPLMIAAMKGHFKMVELLLAQGAKATRTTAANVTALHYAAQSCNHYAIQPLVAAGAEVNIPNQYGQTPLILGADQGCGRVVEELLRVKRIRVEWKDDYGKTAFDYAKDADVIGLDGLGFDLLLARTKPKIAKPAMFTMKAAPQPTQPPLKLGPMIPRPGKTTVEPQQVP